MQITLLQSNLYKLLGVSAYFVLTSFISGCSGGGGSSSNGDSSTTNLVSTTKQPLISYAVLGPLSGSDVKIYRVSDNLIAQQTQTKMYSNETRVIWPENTVGSFVVDINSSFEDNDLMAVEISSGVDIDSNDDGKIVPEEFKAFNGLIRTYATVNDLKNTSVYVNALTHLGSLGITNKNSQINILETLNAYAKKIFIRSINGDNEINYQDLNAYIPSIEESKNFFNKNMYEQLHSSGVIESILDNKNITELLLSDVDGDTLSLEDELYIGSNSNKEDTDGDGLNDNQEISLGSSPLREDTDFDGINDFDEVNLGTKVSNPDSDNDYIPDGIEKKNNTNPLDSDENSNNVLDGLEGDPFFKYQWHIQSNGDVINNTKNISTIAGNDLGIMDVYHYQLGNGSSTVVQVVDTGVELVHEDLKIDISRSLNAINGSQDPSATSLVNSYDSYSPLQIGHGTAVAGIIAARANNSKGLRGVIPYGTIAGSNWLEEQSLYELEKVWYSGAGANEILVSNNSWGSYYLKDKSFEDIMKLASEQLRDGKGRIFTVAAGNERKDYGNANLSYVANNRYAIAVAGLRHDNTYASYSNPGSNILVSAYSGERYFEAPTIASTLLTGESYYESELGSSAGAITFDDDEEKSYTYSMNGTSAATPMVSGSIALTLESCPELTWRDVRWLLSLSSKKVDSEDENWVKNAAGREHNINYGFGLIDADAMIKECRSTYYKKLPALEYISSVVKKDINIQIPDDKTTVEVKIEYGSLFTIEWVELIVNSNHPYSGDLEILLLSPSGTKTQIIAPNDIRSNLYSGGFRFSSAAFMGEKSKGVWKVQVIDQLEGDIGSVHALELKIYGHEE